MFIEPPTRDLSKFADGAAAKPRSTKLSKSQILEFVEAYRAVCKRDNRTCVDCQRMHLYQPMLKLGVIDDSQPLYDENNLQCLCYPCARNREKADRLAAADLTGIIKNQVAEREGRRCVYCLRGSLYGIHADIVPRVSNPDETEPDDWACACKTCKKDRGNLSHGAYGRQCADQAEELAAYLNDTFVIRDV